MFNLYIYFDSYFGDWGLGIVDWGLGIGDWGLGIGPNPQSPIPNPQSPIPNSIQYSMEYLKIFNNFYVYDIYLKNGVFSRFRKNKTINGRL